VVRKLQRLTLFQGIANTYAGFDIDVRLYVLPRIEVKSIRTNHMGIVFRIFVHEDIGLADLLEYRQSHATIHRDTVADPLAVADIKRVVQSVLLLKLDRREDRSGRVRLDFTGRKPSTCNV